MIFTKMQGAGNDFVILTPRNANSKWAELARIMCDRHFGIGADGLILALPSRVADIKMRMFNPDGSEAESCGNGLRCLAKYSILTGLVKAGSPKMSIETIPGIRNVKLEYRGSILSTIQVGVGIPIFNAADIPVKIDISNKNGPILDYPLTIEDHKLLLNFVSMGNPHAVSFLDGAVTDFPLTQIGPKVEHHASFPKRINFEIANIIDRKTIRMRVWERGAGETLACGTGACAVAVIAQLHNYIDNLVDIILPGGILNIAWDKKGEVLMNGPAETVFTGEWPES